MSTYVYLTCLDHTPPLTASEESGQHLYDLPQIRADVLHRRVLVEAYEIDYAGPEAYFRRNSVRFLHQHKTCRIGIVDEYDREHQVIDTALIDNRARQSGKRANAQQRAGARA